MSIHKTTIAHFMSLTSSQLRMAIRLCDEEIKTVQEHLATKPTDSVEYEVQLDELASAITLRKVHKARLNELEAEGEETDGSTVAIAA